jgi:hypothetical protein
MGQGHSSFVDSARGGGILAITLLRGRRHCCGGCQQASFTNTKVLVLLVQKDAYLLEELGRHDKGNSSVEAGLGGGGASDVKRSIRGRPKGACDVRPRRPRAKRRPDGCAGSASSDGWSKDEQTSDALEWISNISSTQNLSLPLAPKGLAFEVGGGGMGAGPGLQLKKLPSDPMGPAFRKQDKDNMSHGVQGDLTSLIFNSRYVPSLLSSICQASFGLFFGVCSCDCVFSYLKL